MSESVRGIGAMVGACLIWGLSPLYYDLLKGVTPGEVLAYRTLWSFAFFAGVIALQGRLGRLREALGAPKRAGLILLSGLFIGANWFGFIYAVHNDRALEASLGYYVFPLMAVLVGRIVFGETLAGLQWLAVGIAAAAVGLLTLGLGVPPWIALLLAVTFSLYGLMKKRLPAGPVVSVTAEVLMLSPLAIVWIWARGTGPELWEHALLALSGPLTATPLILFSYAAKRAKLSTIGLVQYLNPTLQFFVAVLIFAEPFTLWHGIAFPAIWVALTLYSISAVAQDRSARRAASSEATSRTAIT